MRRSSFAELTSNLVSANTKKNDYAIYNVYRQELLNVDDWEKVIIPIIFIFPK